MAAILSGGRITAGDRQALKAELTALGTGE